MPCDQFPANWPNEPLSPIDVVSTPSPRSPVSSSLDNVVPQIIVRSPRVRPGKFVFIAAKRLLQQYLPNSRHQGVYFDTRRLPVAKTAGHRVHVSISAKVGVQ